MKTSLLESRFKKVVGFKAWNFIKKRLWHSYSPVNLAQFFKKPYLQNTSGWLLLLIPPFQPRFFPLIILFSCFPSFFLPFIVNNCNYGSLFRQGIKMKVFLLFTIIYPKINVNVVKNNFALAIICRLTLEKMQISLGNCRLPRRISKADFLKQLRRIDHSKTLMLYCFFLCLPNMYTSTIRWFYVACIWFWCVKIHILRSPRSTKLTINLRCTFKNI